MLRRYDETLIVELDVLVVKPYAPRPQDRSED
jgi:hypothetical protein